MCKFAKFLILFQTHHIFYTYFFFIFISISLLSHKAQAETDLSQKTTQHRLIENAHQYPFSAIGTIRWAGVSQRSSCTGALIAADLVVTAAHCLINQRTGKTVAPQMVHFASGYQKEKFLAHSTGIEIFTSGLFEFSRYANLSQIQQDWAIIRLKDPIGLKAGYLGWVVFNQDALKRYIPKKAKATVAGYPRDRIHALSTESNCKLSMGQNNPYILQHNCQLIQGDSGGPILALAAQQATLIGINSAAGTENKNYAITLQALQPYLKTLLNQDKAFTKADYKKFSQGYNPLVSP